MASVVGSSDVGCVSVGSGGLHPGPAGQEEGPELLLCLLQCHLFGCSVLPGACLAW